MGAALEHVYLQTAAACFMPYQHECSHLYEADLLVDLLLDCQAAPWMQLRLRTYAYMHAAAFVVGFFGESKFPTNIVLYLLEDTCELVQNFT